MNKCVKCGREFTGDYCTHCGSVRVHEECPVCGAQKKPGATYCHSCGYSFWSNERRAKGAALKISRFILPLIAVIALASLLVFLILPFIKLSSGGAVIENVRGINLLFGGSSTLSSSLAGVAAVDIRITVYTAFSWAVAVLSVILILSCIFSWGRYTKKSLTSMIVLSIVTAIFTLAALIEYIIVKNSVSASYTVWSAAPISFIVSAVAVITNVATVCLFNPSLKRRQTLVSDDVKYFPGRTIQRLGDAMFDHKFITALIIIAVLIVIAGFVAMFFIAG